ncbi:complement C1r subcomponent-like isoform X3 [Alosa sapidissima]|uniref:complement C1r subcomponent-like isoform X3 n=1 Tax=Alosa sapidissima TaxID=34773 RepID=UPI001C0877DB|nr:complement C1r subcomponent-like isoform X3 [Alosa sapidissima]
MKWKYSVLCTLLGVSVCVCESISPEVMYGEVKSPLYPQPYPAGVYEEWDLTVPTGYKIQLTFTHLDIEPSDDCYYDSLMVIYNDNILWKFCGQANSADGNHPGNQPILAPGNRLRLIFQADETNPGLHKHLGFSVFYQAVDVDECAEGAEPGKTSPCSQICLNTLGSYFCSCHHGYNLRADQRTCMPSCQGGEFRELEGTLSSPGYPEPSPHGLHCLYNISVEPGFLITLNFTHHFHIEHINNPQPSCLYHWLQVTIPGSKPRKLCGSESPGVMVTGSHWVQLEYHTDWAGLSRGWSLHYTTQRVKCEIPNGVDNGRVTPSLTEYLYKDYIHVRCLKGYKLMQDGREIEAFGSMCHSNGRWHKSLPECHITDCGDPKPLLNGRVTFLSITEKQYLSVIEYQCNEPYYAFQESDRVRYTCAVDGVWRDRNNSDIIPPCVPVCGRPETVKNGNVPWFVSVSVDGGKGAGSVIGNRWILTAASSLLPRGDATTTTRQVKLSINESALEVTALHIHPSYNQSDSLTYFNHNIALVKLRSLITFNADVTPLCLPTEKSDRAGLRGLVSAFPSNSSNDKGIWLPLVDHGKCNSSKPEVLSAKTLCSEGARSLLSDYMGAALGVEEDGRFGAAGVFIQTVANQEGGAYGVYTRVSQYQHWIRDTIQQHYCEHPELPNMVELVDHDIRYEQHSELQLQCASKYYSLQGEEKYTCAADGVWRSGTGHSVWPTCVPVCGITEVPLHSSARILGGRAARLGAVPWQLLMKVPYRAGASLLNDRWALTAASVVDGHTDRNLTLYGGMVDSLDSKQVVMVSEKVVIHPGYKRGLSEDELTSYDNDIALIKLSSRVRLGPTLRPVCLPERTTGSAALEGKMGTVSGFGTWEKGLRSRRLRHAPIREYAREQCAETPVHGLQQQPMAFTHNMFCAGLEATDSCQGDSGGPLVQPVVGLQRPGQLYRVKGIVSWGPVCGSKTYYTKVQNYLDWITETMEKD